MSTYQRQPGDLAIQVYLPRDLGLEIGKLRLETRQTNNVIVAELLREALVARGLLEPSEAQPPRTETKTTNAGTSGKEIKPTKPLVKNEKTLRKGKAVVAAVAKAAQEKLATLNKSAPAVEVTVSDSVSAVDAVEPAVVAPPVAEPDPHAWATAVFDAAAEAAAKAGVDPWDDEEIDFAALAQIEDEPVVVRNPFACLDTPPKPAATPVVEDDAPVLDPFKLVNWP